MTHRRSRAIRRAGDSKAGTRTGNSLVTQGQPRRTGWSWQAAIEALRALKKALLCRVPLRTPRRDHKAEGKVTHRTGVGKKLPAGQVQKLPAGRCKKLPSYYIPGEPCLLVGRWAGKRTCWQTVSETDAEVLAMRAPSSRRVSLIGVVSAGELAERLRRAGQDEWCTRVRLGGLLLLIDFLCRNHAVGGFPVAR